MQFKATIVESYSVFWVNVTSNKVYIKSDEKDSVSSKLISDKRTSYYNYVEYEDETRAEAENLTDFMLLFQNKSGSKLKVNKTNPLIQSSRNSSKSDMTHHNSSFSTASNEINEMTQIYANDVSDVETARETTGHETHEIHDKPSDISIIIKEPEIEMSDSYTDNYSYTGSENDTGQLITNSSNTSLSSSQSPTDAATATTATTLGDQATGTELDLPTNFIINSSSTEKTGLHENPENHFTTSNSIEKDNQNYTDNDLILTSFASVSTPESLSSTQTMNSVYFQILPTYDEDNEIIKEKIDLKENYVTFDELEPMVNNSPTFYNENMTEVIIIRECSAR